MHISSRFCSVIALGVALSHYVEASPTRRSASNMTTGTIDPGLHLFYNTNSHAVFGKNPTLATNWTELSSIPGTRQGGASIRPQDAFSGTGDTNPLQFFLAGPYRAQDGRGSDSGASEVLINLPQVFAGTSNTMIIQRNTYTDCLDGPCSSEADCGIVYSCIFQSLHNRVSSFNPGGFTTCTSGNFPRVIQNVTSSTKNSSTATRPETFRCPFSISTVETLNNNNCNSAALNLTADNWKVNSVDSELGTAMRGGVDSLGYFWEGRQPSSPAWSLTFQSQFLNKGNRACLLKQPCVEQFSCLQAGSWLAKGGGMYGLVEPVTWVYLATAAFSNINQQLFNQYSELKDAIESLALDAFSIDDFQPKKSDSNSNLVEALNGFASVFSIFGGFIPFAGPAISGAGTILSTTASFLSTEAGRADPLNAQKSFSEIVLQIYKSYLTAFEKLVESLFNGEQIGSGSKTFNITDMMSGGAWVNPGVITPVAELNNKIRTEIYGRAINQLWKKPSSNKMWVLFVDLQDHDGTSNCDQDKSGPQDSKYCADGGAYYLYNFIEQGEDDGGVWYPWGAKKLEEKTKIPLKWVTESSAKSYQALKGKAANPFDFQQVNASEIFLSTVIKTYNDTDYKTPNSLSSAAGRFAGTWTVPVCNASTWGKAWNSDYTTSSDGKNLDGTTHPPCLCGPNGSETSDWATAAGMKGFETFWHRCTVALEKKEFVWPSGTTEVRYPTNDGKNPYTVRKPK